MVCVVCFYMCVFVCVCVYVRVRVCHTCVCGYYVVCIFVCVYACLCVCVCVVCGHSQDGQYIAAGSHDGTVFVWEVATGKVRSKKEHS